MKKKTVKKIKSPLTAKDLSPRSPFQREDAEDEIKMAISETLEKLKEKFPNIGIESNIMDMKGSISRIRASQAKVIKTIPATKYLKEFDELDKLGKQITSLIKIRDAKNELLWANIESDLNSDNHMRFNSKTKEIEILED